MTTPILIQWHSGDRDSRQRFSELMQCWPEDVRSPLLLLDHSDQPVHHGEQPITPLGYRLVQQPIKALPIDPDKAYKVDVSNIHLEQVYGEYQLVEGASEEEFPIHFAQSLGTEGLIIDCYFEKTGRSRFSLAGSPRIAFTGDHLRNLIEHLRFTRGQKKLLNRNVWQRANDHYHQATRMELNWFSESWRLQQLATLYTTNESLLEYVSSYENTQNLARLLFKPVWESTLTDDQIHRICEFLNSKIRNHPNETLKLWFCEISEASFERLLAGFASLLEDKSRFISNTSIYLTSHDATRITIFQSKIDHYGHRRHSQHETATTLSDSKAMAIRGLHKRLIIHTQHNVFVDPPYLHVDLIVCSGLLLGLSEDAHINLGRKLFSIQKPQSLLAVEENELSESLVDYQPLTSHPGMYRAIKAAGEPTLYKHTTPPPQSLNTRDGQAEFLINTRNIITAASGQVEQFTVHPFNHPEDIIRKSIDTVLGSQIVDAVLQLIRTRLPDGSKKQVLLTGNGIVLMAISPETELRSDHVKLTLDKLDTIEVNLPEESYGSEGSGSSLETAIKHLATVNKKRQQSIETLEQLSLDLARSNDELAQENEQKRLLSQELLESNQAIMSKLQSELARKNLLLETIDRFSNPTILLDHQGKVLEINKPAMDLSEFTISRGDNLFEIKHSLPKVNLRESFQMVVQERTEGRFRYQRATGLSEVCLTPAMVDNKFSGVLLEVKPYQNTYTEEADYSDLLNVMAIGTVITDRDDNIISSDEVIQQWVGSETSFIDRPFASLLAKDYESMHHTKVEDLNAGRFVDYEAPLVSEDTKLIWCRIRGIRLEANGDHRLLYFIESITEQRRTQKEMLVAQKMESLGLLTGGIAHDFNNILAVIMGYTDLMMYDTGATDPIVLQRNLQHIRRSGERGRHLIKQMLFYSRGDERHEISQLSVSTAINTMLPLLRSSFPTDINLTTQIFDDSAVIAIDPTHFDQILMNLCINARDAILETGATDGEIVVSVSRETPDNVHRCASCHATFGSPPEEHIVIRVTDNGPGIKEDIIEHMFDPFFSTKEVGKGSGMGLSVVHGLIHQYNGHIRLYNSNYGAQMTIWLPASVEEAEIETETGSSPGEKLPYKRVLVVEDEPGVANLMLDVLRYLGLEPVHCKNGQEAIDWLNEGNSVELVITDLAMPRMSGETLALHLEASHPDLPVLMLTGNDSILGDTEFSKNIKLMLNKPVSIQTLSESLRNILL